jgi:hypothetical protein
MKQNVPYIRNEAAAPEKVLEIAHEKARQGSVSNSDHGRVFAGTNCNWLSWLAE